MMILALMGVVALAQGVSTAQDAPSPPAAPVAAENWQTYSRSADNAFLAEVDGLVFGVGLTQIRVAAVPRAGGARDLSHSVRTYQFQCTAGKWRTAGEIAFGPDGSEIGRSPEEDAGFETVRPDTMPGDLKAVACDGAPASSPHWSSITAFIEAGRP